MASWFASKPALGAPLTAVISVERATAASDCPDGATLTRSVERILQRSLTGRASADETLQVAVRFSADHDDYSADVRSLGQKPGERRLRDRGRSCAALAEAVSVAIALLLDKELQLRPQPEPASPAPEPAVQAPVAAPPSRPPNQPELRPPLELRAAFEGGFVAGLPSSSSALLSEQIGVRVQRRLLLDSAFNAVLPTTSEYGAGSVRTTLLFASMRACYTWGQRFSIGPCALFGIGRLHGSGLGYAAVRSDDLLWTALGAGVVAEAPVWGRVFCGLAGHAWLPTRSSGFSVENRGTAWEASQFGGALVARFGFRIW